MKTEMDMFLVKLARNNELSDITVTSRTNEQESALVRF